MLNLYRHQPLLQRCLHSIMIGKNLVGISQPKEINISQQQHAAKKVVEDYFTALNENDLQTLTGLFHEHAVEMLDDKEELLGQENIKDNFERLLQKIKHHAILQHSFTRINGNIAVVESETQMKLKMLETGIEIPTTDKDLFILKRDENQWKIEKHICNGNSYFGDKSSTIN